PQSPPGPAITCVRSNASSGRYTEHERTRMPKLTRTLATVELADGTIHQDVRIINPDLLRYRETAQKHGWPALEVRNEVGRVPHLDYEQTFTAWAALRRLELY